MPRSFGFNDVQGLIDGMQGLINGIQGLINGVQGLMVLNPYE
ncbi:hypothetical protein [Crocosphaera watsonii]|uniref:Uncharacterized protein n=1 Tax=Crocosphaera watsonii WH 8502 TaxID=423474 RepID=T2IBA9_CROWT|nr:hypothetical protein [Crocosphaera watsonii]CCQ50811.1 hypothetical protein CWATWH8502_3409 [Crocosphaera watsonii WH 8502]